MIIFCNGQRFSEHRYQLEQDFEADIVNNYKSFFGERTIYIEAKKKISADALGRTIPDGFLFDFSNPDAPEFYLVEVELKSHGFFDHIFPQITKFFAFYTNLTRQKELVEKLFSLIEASLELHKQFRCHLGDQEIYKFLINLIDNSQNILLVIDGDKPELPEIMNTYTEWGKMVKLMVIKKFIGNGEPVFSVTPEFEAVEYTSLHELSSVSQEVVIDEEYHLVGIDDRVKNIYMKLKETVAEINSAYQLNPTKSYISIRNRINRAFIYIQKRKVKLDVLLSEDKVREIIQSYSVQTLPPSAKDYYHSECAGIAITDMVHFEEIKRLLEVLFQDTEFTQN